MQQPSDRTVTAILPQLRPDIAIAVDRSLPEAKRILEQALLYIVVCALWGLVLLSFLHGLG